jgi:hypothetical protein
MLLEPFGHQAVKNKQNDYFLNLLNEKKISINLTSVIPYSFPNVRQKVPSLRYIICSLPINAEFIITESVSCRYRKLN